MFMANMHMCVPWLWSDFSLDVSVNGQLPSGLETGNEQWPMENRLLAGHCWDRKEAAHAASSAVIPRPGTPAPETRRLGGKAEAVCWEGRGPKGGWRRWCGLGVPGSSLSHATRTLPVQRARTRHQMSARTAPGLDTQTLTVPPTYLRAELSLC